MLAGIVEQAPHDVQSVFAGGQGQRRLVAVLRRQGAHGGGSDVGRIGNDEIVAAAVERREQVGTMQGDARIETVVGDIAARHRQGILGEIDGIDARAGESQSQQDGEAARAGAQVQGVLHRAGIDPGREGVFHEQAGDVRARHDDALVDMEAVVAQPGFVSKIGGRNAFRDAPIDQRGHRFLLGSGEARIEKGLQAVWRQVQRMQYQPGRLVVGILRAVAEEQAGGVEAADCPAQHVAQREQFGGDHRRSSASARS